MVQLLLLKLQAPEMLVESCIADASGLSAEEEADRAPCIEGSMKKADGKYHNSPVKNPQLQIQHCCGSTMRWIFTLWESLVSRVLHDPYDSQ